MPAKTDPSAGKPVTAQPRGGLVFGGLQGAHAMAGAGVEAWSRGLNRSGRAALAAHALNGDYADRFLKLNLEAVPRAAPSPTELSRHLSVGGQWAALYVRYLRDCGAIFTKALSDKDA